MNETERINHIVSKYGEYNPTTIDLLVGIVFEFDIFAEIEKALAGKPSLVSEAVADAVSYTRPDGASIFETSKEAL